MFRKKKFRSCKFSHSDGFIKVWDVDEGKISASYQEHNGWVTDFLYWPEMKLLISASNDGWIVVWGSGGTAIDHIPVNKN